MNYLNLWYKEILEMVRDRKGMRQTLLIPLILGLFYAVLNPALGELMNRRSQETIFIPVQGLAYADPAFVETFSQFDIELEPYEGDMETAVQTAEEAAGIIFTPGFAENIADETDAQLILLTNPTSGGMFGGGLSINRIELALSAYNQQLTVQRLQSRNIDPDVLTPVTLDAQNLSTAAQRAGATAAFFLPMLVAIGAVNGGSFIAIDATAGEKERGTLEALLATPASDVQIFVGKLMAVFTVTAVPIALTLFGFWAGTAVLPNSMTNGAGPLPVTIIIAAILVTLPLALFANVVLMVISIRTKGFKEAQSAMSPVLFGVTFVALAAAFVPPSQSIFFLIPVYGTSAVVGVLAQGGVIPANAVLFSVLGSVVGTAVIVVIALRLFNRERLLYSM
ncbi:MAG: ABC transporter permease [Chloroflexi bacterium]|nr:ABC transporter permease [Chloroflexota bacterium]